jgi:hypothetical protein
MQRGGGRDYGGARVTARSTVKSIADIIEAELRLIGISRLSTPMRARTAAMALIRAIF